MIVARCSQRCSHPIAGRIGAAISCYDTPEWRSTDLPTSTAPHALVAADEADDKALYLGPDRAGNMLEIVTVVRDDGTEIAIHAMPMRPIDEMLLHNTGRADD